MTVYGSRYEAEVSTQESERQGKHDGAELKEKRKEKRTADLSRFSSSQLPRPAFVSRRYHEKPKNVSPITVAALLGGAGWPWKACRVVFYGLSCSLASKSRVG